MKQYDVLALGELNVDMILTGLSTMPVPGREIIAENCSVVMGSSTAICAAGIAKLGLRTAFLGRVGRDAYGELAGAALAGYGVDMSRLIVDDRVPTGITVSISSRDNRDRALVTHLGAIDSLSAADVDRDLLSRVRHVHVGSFFLQSKLRPGLAGLFEEARRQGATTSLDAGWDNSECWDYGIRDVLCHTDVFLPNELEATAITGCADVPEAAAELSRLCRICAVKWGKRGAFVASGGRTWQAATYKAEVVDTTGAGDSFNAGFLYGFLNGMPMEECIAYGNACGTVSVTRVGGASSCASAEEARRVIETGEWVV